jgi:hypothetical protein
MEVGQQRIVNSRKLRDATMTAPAGAARQAAVPARNSCRLHSVRDARPGRFERMERCAGGGRTAREGSRVDGGTIRLASRGEGSPASDVENDAGPGRFPSLTKM